LKNFFLFIAIVVPVLFLNLTGCIPSKPTEEVEILPSERLINKLEVNRRKIRNFEGHGTINITSPKFTGSAAFNVILQKPDSIYLTVMGPFNIELANALVTKDNFIFYDALKNTAYTGKVSDNILSEIFKINLSFADLMEAFVGSVNLTENLYKIPDDYKVEYDEYVITYIDSTKEVKKRYKVNIRELGITDFNLRNFNNEVLLDGKYSKFEILDNVAIPFRINVFNMRDDQKVLIEYKDIRVNKKNIFIDFKIPADASLIRW